MVNENERTLKYKMPTPNMIKSELVVGGLWVNDTSWTARNRP